LPGNGGALIVDPAVSEKLTAGSFFTIFYCFAEDFSMFSQLFFVLGLVDLSYPPLLAAIFVSNKAESTPCSCLHK
jgi:hypothetical protein